MDDVSVRDAPELEGYLAERRTQPTAGMLHTTDEYREGYKSFKPDGSGDSMPHKYFGTIKANRWSWGRFCAKTEHEKRKD